MLVWTTTPWTLPSNVALAVDPELTYAEVELGERNYILAEARVEPVLGAEATVARRFPGAELVGTKYVRPFDLIPSDDAGPNSWTVHPGDFVTAEDGTGIVHLAPAFGADDYTMGQKYDLPMYNPLDEAGRFKEWIPVVGGLFVKAADQPLVEDLEQRGRLFRFGMAEHSYPHCWRCSSRSQTQMGRGVPQ